MFFFLKILSEGSGRGLLLFTYPMALIAEFFFFFLKTLNWKLLYTQFKAYNQLYLLLEIQVLNGDQI